jgi:hypothetical protein
VDRFIPEGPARRARLGLWRLIRALHARLPAEEGPLTWPWPLLLKSADTAGRVASRLRLHGPSPEQLQEVFADKEPADLRRLARAVVALEFRNRVLLEVVPRAGVDRLRSIVVADESWKRVEPPAILVAFHTGASYALAAGLPDLRAATLAIRDSPFYGAPRGHAVAFSGGGVEPRAAALLGAVRRLAAGGFVLLAVDRPEGTATPPLGCLGRRIHFRRGAFALARITGAPMVPVTARWEPRGQSIRLEAHAPLPTPAPPPEDGPSFEAALAESAARWLERDLRASPEQLWLGSLFELLDAPLA